MRFSKPVIAIATSLAIASGALAQDNVSNASSAQPAGKSPAPSKLDDTGKKAGEIASQPARDVGMAGKKIPPVLEKATEDPYGVAGTKTCKQLSSSMKELNEVLGPDFIAGAEKKENRAGKLAEAGGKTVVNSIIPFRGLIREISGAAPQQRRYEAALEAGLARRGFIRGIHRTRGCKPAL